MGACKSTCSDDVMKVTLLIAAVACGILSLWSIISMTCCKNPNRNVEKRDVAQLFIHLSSVLWTVAFLEGVTIKLNKQEDVSLCTLTIVLFRTGQYLQKFLTLVIWGIRFKTLIGPVYPYWVQWPTLLMTMGIPISFVVDAATVFNGLKLPDGTGCDLSPEKDDVLISEILLIVPAVIFLVLFLLPLFQCGFHRHSGLLGLILWQMMITVLDIGIHLAFVIAYCSIDKADKNGLHQLIGARNVGVLVCNILILGVFVDWRERLVYGCYNSSPDVKPRPKFSRVSSSIGSLLDLTFAKSSDNVEIRNRWQTSLFVDDVMTRISTFSRPRDFSGENESIFVQLKAPLLDD